MRTLVAPIHAPGTYVERSRRNKHGLPNAFRAHGDVLELDYLAISPADLDGVMRSEIDRFQPDLLFLQIQGTDPITEPMLAGWRDSYPHIRVCNWSGDVWEHALVSPPMLDILRHVDMQLVVNASVLPVYAEHGIHAEFCPFGYEAPDKRAVDQAISDLPPLDVVFLGNNYSSERQRLYTALRSVDASVAIYGAGWEQCEGECNYDFATAEALYRRARIAISDNQFPDAKGYMSDRPIQVMAAGGALLLQQTVADLQPLTGLVDGGHYIGWRDIDDLPRLVWQWLNPSRQRTVKRVTQDAQAFVLSRHTWGRRVEKIARDWLPQMREEVV